jgi:Fe-S oxidoreductase
MEYEIIKSILVLLLLLGASGIFLRRTYFLLSINLHQARSSPLFDQWGKRLKGIVIYFFGQVRLFRLLIPGTNHFLIFWGFLFLSLTILQAIFEGLTAFVEPKLTLPILGTFGPLALLQDIFAVLVIIAVIGGLYRRIVVNPDRYKGSHKSQGVIVLVFIMTIMLSLLIYNGLLINLEEDALAEWRPISEAVGVLMIGLDHRSHRVIAELAYWIHLGVVFLFLTELPGGKHFHVATALPKIWLRNLSPVGQLPEVENDEGVSAVDQFQWRQMLDFFTCTECGRCQDVCPAYLGGQTLSPKVLMMSLRDQLIAHDALRRRTASNGKSSGEIEGNLVGQVLSDDFVWGCTTCLACDQECPLFIEHITPIVEMRRHLIMEGRMDEMLQGALDNLGRYGNSFGKSERSRAKWARDIEPAILHAGEAAVEHLWFVGDYASYSPNQTRITQMTAEVFNAIGLNYGILFEAERNSGNDVRRVGEEGLFEMLREQNIEALKTSSFETLITTDPHTYNTLKNEYCSNGYAAWDVRHYSELLDETIASGRLQFSSKLGSRVTYHDPCYLGRYNDIYDSPRRVIKSTGCELVEMRNNRDRALCCGAGGGRIWMEEETEGERVSEMRIREAVSVDGVEIFVVACPKDYSMYQDAVKTTGNEDRLVVKDLIELVHEAL